MRTVRFGAKVEDARAVWSASLARCLSRSTSRNLPCGRRLLLLFEETINLGIGAVGAGTGDNFVLVFTEVDIRNVVIIQIVSGAPLLSAAV